MNIVPSVVSAITTALKQDPAIQAGVALGNPGALFRHIRGLMRNSGVPMSPKDIQDHAIAATDALLT